MTFIDYNIVPGTPNTSALEHLVRCHQCEQQFNALAEPWCQCDLKTRTLTCPHCSTCFCRAPAPYKERFWREAPAALSGNASRFRLGDDKTTAAILASPALPAAPKANRLLVVDDEEHMRSIVACYTEQMGYKVTSVATPAEALSLLETMTFDVVVTDALMPGMDGRELCQRIKQTYGRSIKVVVMTSLYTAYRYKVEAQTRFGADEYLSKPVHFDVLKAALDRVAAPTAA